MFEFTIPWDDLANTVTDLRFLNETTAGQHGFVGISQDGHFTYHNERIRFFGGSLSYGANFPDHETAWTVARRLAKLGCNLVRLHHMDCHFSTEGEGIWEPGHDGAKRYLDSNQMEKLDYFINELKQNGIFIDLNLHVSRTLTAADGIKHDDNMPPCNKGVDIFDATMRDLHKEYAIDLLTHVNQCTQLPYYNDPVIAMVEVTNEDSLLVVWSQNGPGVQVGWIDSLGDYYQEELDDLWGDWWEEHVGGSPPRRPTRNQVASGDPEQCTEELAKRYIGFLLSLEEDYHDDMVDHLRNIAAPGVGLQVPISGTQPGALDATILSSTFHDQHACYACWNRLNQFFLDSITKYPFLPGHRPIPYISGAKVTGKPYVATEVSSPHPNPHAAEPIILAALYGAFQDWDGMLPYSYKHYSREWNKDYVSNTWGEGSKFDFDRHMTKLVAVTVAALLFRRNDISIGDSPPLEVKTTREEVLKHPYGNSSINLTQVTSACFYLPDYTVLMRRVETDKAESHIEPDPPADPEDHIYRTDTGQLQWYNDPDHRDDAFFKADTENVHVLAGAIGEQQFTFQRGILADGSISVYPITSSALIAMILRDISPQGTKTYLIIATAEMQNFGQEISDPVSPPGEYPELRVITEWGEDHVEVDAIEAYIILPVPPGNVTFHSLNPNGSENTQLDVDQMENYCGLRLSASNETLWYKLVIT
jgi:hypothetical protein